MHSRNSIFTIGDDLKEEIIDYLESQQAENSSITLIRKLN